MQVSIKHLVNNTNADITWLALSPAGYLEALATNSYSL